MPLSLFKLLAMAITGTTGVGGVVYPFAYAGATRDSHQTLGKKKLNNALPIITCSVSDDKYEVELITEGGAEGSEIALEVFKEKRNEGRNSKDKESELEGKIQDDWSGWESKKVIFGGNKKGESARSTSGTNISSNCEGEMRVEGKEIKRNRQEKNIREIKLVAKNCSDGLFSKTCDIEFSEDSGLKGKGNYKPTITYSAF